MMKKFLMLFASAVLLCGCIAPEMKLRINKEEKTPLTVVAMLPLSGANRAYAEQMRDGLLCAESEINRNGGVSGRFLKLELLDTCGTASGTRMAIDRALKLNAAAIVAGYSSEEVGMITAHASALRMPTVIPLATSDQHIKESPFVYRNCYSDLQQMEVLAAYLHFWRNLRQGAILIDPVGSPDYSRSVARDFEQSVRDNGGTIVYKQFLPEDGSLPEAIFRDMLACDPLFILVPASGKRAAAIFKKLRQSGFNGIICGPDSWDDTEFTAALAGVEPGEVIYTALFTPENDHQEYVQFKENFRKQFFYLPDACSTQSYDALKFLAIGLADADNLLKFDRNWRTIRNHSGAAAVYTMLKNGGIDRTVYLNSIGVRRGGRQIIPYPRLSMKLQYSKLEEYRIVETPDEI